jgi:elongation factor Tu
MPTDSAFRMTIEDVFSIRGRGTVVTGRIEQGTISVGDTVQLERPGFSTTVVVDGVETFRRSVKGAQAGDNVGLLLRDVSKDEVQKGDVLAGSGYQFSSNF